MPFRRPGHSNSGLPPEQDEDTIWEKLATTHPELADELAGRLPAWVSSRKRRGSRERTHPDFSTDGWGRQPRESFLNNFPSEFRQYIPSQWSKHFDSGNVETEPQNSSQQASRTPKFERQHSSEKATQTVEGELTPNLNQYKLRNTVDLGQKTEAELGNLEGDQSRKQRSMSAPPSTRISSNENTDMDPPLNMGNPPHHQQQSSQPHDESNHINKQPNVRHIPIFVEGRDEPVINAGKDIPINFAESRATPPKEQYFMEHDIPPSFHPHSHTYNRAWSPFEAFGKRNTSGFGPKKFSQSNNHPQHNFTQQPTHTPQSQNIHVENQNPSYDDILPSQSEWQEQKPGNQHKDEVDADTQQKPQQSHNILVNDPIAKIQSIQKDVLDLMSKVETFSGNSKKDKEYIYLDEMLTRNLIKLDDVETEGKENIRLARKEAIKCIQQCIAVLEAKVDGSSETGGSNTNEVNMEEGNAQNTNNEQEESKESVPPVDIATLGISNNESEKNPMEVDTNEPSSQ